MPNAQQLGPVSPDLEHHVLRILGVKNPLDAPDLDPTEYINRLFPNGKRKKKAFTQKFHFQNSEQHYYLNLYIFMTNTIIVLI